MKAVRVQLPETIVPREVADEILLAARGIVFKLVCNELDGVNPALAEIDRREPRADSLGPNSTAGRLVNGLRTGAG